MSDAAAPRQEGPGLDQETVAAWLKAHPRFLADRPDLYRRLAPPARVHGDVLADHMTAMLRAERAHATAMAERADGVLAAGRAAAGLAERVQEAVLALIAAEDVVDCIGTEVLSVLALDGAALCTEVRGVRGARQLPAGTVARLLAGRSVLFREGGADAGLLHGEAAALACYDALVRVPGEPASLLALAARRAHMLDPRQGTGALAFLGRAVAAALLRGA